MDDDFDLGEEKKSSNKLIFLIGGGMVVILAIAIGATLYFIGFFSSPANNVEQAEQQGKETVAGESKTAVSPIYADLEPAFIVNFQNNKHARLLQLSLTILSYEQEIVDAIEKHKPMLRNNLLLLLSDQDPAKLKKADGKQSLRKSIFDAINKVLDETEKLAGIEQVFFTTFIMQ